MLLHMTQLDESRSINHSASSPTSSVGTKVTEYPHNEGIKILSRRINASHDKQICTNISWSTIKCTIHIINKGSNKYTLENIVL